MTIEQVASNAGVERVRRRGLVAGAAALVAGLLAKETVDSPHVAAAASLQFANTAEMVVNNGLGSTNLVYTSDVPLQTTNLFTVADGDFTTTSDATAAVAGYAYSKAKYGVYGYSSFSTGVFGGGTNGVYGLANNEGIGVWGNAPNGFGTGVQGSGDGYGVWGIGKSGDGVVGETFAPPGSGRAGVVGGENGPGTYGVFGAGVLGGTGVYGTTAAYGTSSGEYGVFGDAAQGVGVYGRSNGGASSYGVLGTTAVTGGYALNGTATVAGAVAVGGTASNGAVAGQFSGSVNITGDLTVIGNCTATGAKSAAVPHPDGSHRLMYCMESPEAWFEDFGESTLAAGRAEVKLDPDFAAIVNTSTMHVFCFEHGDNHNLYLAARNASGFTIQASAGALTARSKNAADVNGTFTWRVVAERKDVQAGRLAKFNLPKQVAAKLPPAPSAPPAPRSRPASPKAPAAGKPRP